MIERFLFSIGWCAALLAAMPACHGAAALSERPPLPKARVIVVTEAGAVNAFVPQPEVVERLVQRGLQAVTGKINAGDAWRTLVATNDVVGIKVHSAPGPNSGTRGEVVAAVVEGLLEAGLPPRQIVIWDKNLWDLRLANYFELADRYGVRIESSSAAGYDEENFYETALLGNLVWGDLEFGRKGDGVGRKSFVSKLVSRELTKIISITPLLNHNQAGVTGHLHSLAMGSVDNTLRFESSQQHLAVAVPEICALPLLGDRVVLNIVDALICQYQGEQRSLLHYSAILNQLRFSTDPVALDVLSLEELQRQRQRAEMPNPKPPAALFENATLLEIGVSDRRQIEIEWLR